MDTEIHLAHVCEELVSLQHHWGAHEGMIDSHVRSSPLGRLVAAFGEPANPHTRKQLSWLVFFAARRALSCWECYCDTTEPHDALKAIETYLLSGISPSSWTPYTIETLPSYKGVRIVDCRACDTECASAAVATAAKFMETGTDLFAIYALSDADAAFDQSPLGGMEEFRYWLLKVAVPIAYEAREMTLEEQNLYRDYDPQEIPLRREQFAGHS
jgi:hypothetical protein